MDWRSDRREGQAQAVRDNGQDSAGPAEAETRERLAPPRAALAVLETVSLAAAGIGLAAMTAVACVLSYSSVNFFAARAGMPVTLASIYPLIFDATLVIAGWAVLTLSGAELVSRLYAWLCLFMVLVALAGISAVYAAGTSIARHSLQIGITVAPFGLVLLGVGLVLVLRQHARAGRLSRHSAWAAEIGSRVLLTQNNVTILPGTRPGSGTDPGPAPAATERSASASDAAASQKHHAKEHDARQHAPRQHAPTKTQGTGLPRRSDSEPRAKIPSRRSDPAGTQSSPPWTRMTDPAPITSPQPNPIAVPRPTAPEGPMPPGGGPAPNPPAEGRPRPFQDTDDVWRFRARPPKFERLSQGSPTSASPATGHSQADPEEATTSTATEEGEEKP